MMNKIEAVIFDMDGLMVDTEKIVIECYKKVSRVLNIDIPLEVLYQLVGRTKKDSAKILSEFFNYQVDGEKIRELTSQEFRKYVKINKIPIKEGLYEVLEFLEKNNIKRAVGTSSRLSNAQAVLTSVNVIQYFDIIITGDQVSKGKPNPEVFLKASEKLGVEPSKCLVLEDSNAGIEAANAAGMYSIVIPDLVAPTEETKTRVYRQCKSLVEVIPILEQNIYDKSIVRM